MVIKPIILHPQLSSTLTPKPTDSVCSLIFTLAQAKHRMAYMPCLMRHSLLSASVNAAGEQSSRKKMVLEGRQQMKKKPAQEEVRRGRKTVTSTLRQFNDTLENCICIYDK